MLPLLAQVEFGLASKSAVLSFIATFGVVKALTNLFAGRLSDIYGRKRVLLAGWLVGLPVPFLVIWAPELVMDRLRECAAGHQPGARAGPRRSS